MESGSKGQKWHDGYSLGTESVELANIQVAGQTREARLMFIEGMMDAILDYRDRERRATPVRGTATLRPVK